MKLSMLFTGGESLEQIVALGQQAEAAGFDGLYMVEAYRSAWVALTALAGVTQRVTLGPYVLNAYARSPLLTGMTAIDFNEYANGRLMLGIGGGNPIINEVWQGIPHARVLTKMRETVEILQRMARARVGEEIRYEGQVHHMQWTPVTPSSAPFPVLLAAIFPAMLRVAAGVADGIAGGATLSPEYLREVRTRAASFATDAGRDPNSLRWSAVMFTAVHSDREVARHAARNALAHLFAPLPHPYYEYTMREQGYADVVGQLKALMPAGELDAAIDTIPDKLINEMTIAGTFDECRARLRAYEEVVDELLLINVLPVDERGAQAAHVDFFRLAGAVVHSTSRSGSTGLQR